MAVDGPGGEAASLEAVTPGGPRAAVAAVVRRFAVSLTIMGIVVGLQAATALDAGLHPWLTEHFGVDWETFRQGQWYRFAVSPLFQHSPGFGGLNQFLILLVPVLEWRAGPRLTLAVFALGDWLSTIPALVFLRVAGEWNATAMAAANTLDSGSSSASIAVAAALAVLVPQRSLRIGCLAALFGALILRVLLYGNEYDWQHLLAGCVGAALTVVARRDIASRSRMKRPPE